MKLNIKRRKLKKTWGVNKGHLGRMSMYAYGGNYNIDNYDPYTQNGSQQVLGSIGSGVATGASVGSTFGPWGTAIGAIGGAAVGAVGGISEAQKAQKAWEDSKERERDRREDISKAILTTYPTKGVEGATGFYMYGGKKRNTAGTMYACGGKMKYAMGGMMQGVNPQQFQPVASNVQEVNGAKHEQGGVYAGQGNEVEDAEVLAQQKDGSTNVYSDRLEYAKGVTFADKAEELGKKKGKFEEDLESTSLFVKGSARRNIEKIDNQLNLLFMQQEGMKNKMGIPSPQEQQIMEQQMQPSQEQQIGSEMQTQNAAMTQQVGSFAMGGKMRKYNNGGTIVPNNNPNDIYGGDLYFQGTYFDKDKLNNLTLTPPDQVIPMTFDPSKEEAAFIEPAYSSTTNAINKPGTKGKINFSDVAGRVLPFVDNAANLAITLNRPEIPKPVPFRNVPLKTDYNINPQLAAIDATESNTARMLKEQTNNSAIYRSNLIASRAGLVSQRNQLYADKENRETALDNQNRLNAQGVQNRNITKEDAYNQANMMRTRSIQNEISANAAEGAEDAQLQIAEDNLKKRDKLELNLLKQQYKDSGVWDRNLEKLFDDYIKGSKTYEDFKIELSKVSK